MNESTLRKLEFDEIRETLAGFCSTALGKRLARTLDPSTKITVIRSWLTQLQEMQTACGIVGMPPLGGVHDIRQDVRASAFPTPLEAEALARISETLTATGPLCRWLERLSPLAPSMATLATRVSDFTAIAGVIDQAIDPRGQVRDYATPKLGSIRNAIESTRNQIKITFDRVLRHSSITKMLQYTGATFHEDRMVLPLKAEYRGRIQGIVHRTSDSGSTLFVEPSESVELNNTIVRLRDEESKEITQILRMLTQHVHLNAEGIQETLRAVGVLDLIAGKCRYAQARDGYCPQINDAGRLILYNARHPVLLELFDRQAKEGQPKKDVMPIDVRLGDDFDVLIITGPNTGGKTVTLKTVGLFALMTQCGMAIPAGEGSVMPVYDNIHIDIGDEQSLQQSLSTFSSHLATLLHILQHSTPRSLVLIDELGAGTDPDEGAAMGRAVLDELLHLGARAIVTTHLSSLKAVAFSTPRVDNAAVEFDVETLKPTYRLKLGEPGNSNALIIAKRLGMPARIVKRARQYFDERTQELSKAIAGTVQLRREAEEARKAAYEAEQQAAKQRTRFEEQRVELQRSQQQFDRWAEWINKVQPGDEVFVRPLNRIAKVVRLQLHRQLALVSARGMDLEVALRDLDVPPPEA